MALISSSLRIISVFLIWALPGWSQAALTTEHIQLGYGGDLHLRTAPSSVGYDAGIFEKDDFASRSALLCADLRSEGAGDCRPLIRFGGPDLAHHSVSQVENSVLPAIMPPASHSIQADLHRRYGDISANQGLTSRALFLCADLMTENAQGCQRPLIPFDRLDHDAGDQVENSELPEIVPPPNHTIRTTTILAGASVAGLITYYLLPERVTGLDKSEAFTGAFNNFKRAFTKAPVIDQDAPAINYFAHPYFGMQYYLSQRNYNESVLWSFTFSSLISIGFEYGVEVFGEQPSIQDLVITSVVGSLVGELNYQLTQRMRKGGFTTFEKIVVTILNPLYVLQNGYR